MKKLLTLFALHLGLAAVVAQPVITCQPSDLTVIAGSNVTLTICATGTPPLSYQWRSYASATTFTNIPFGTDATLVLTNVQPTQRRIGVVITDGGGSSATSTLVQLIVLTLPNFSLQPIHQSVSLGANVRFLVTVTNIHPPIRYQWRLAGTNLANQTNTSLNLTNVDLVNAGDYDVVATDTVGSVTSRMARLDVDPTFTKITTGEIVTDLGYWIRCVWGDFNNDGFLDLFVTDYPRLNAFYRNNSDGTFTKIAQGDPVQDVDYHTGVAAGDYDNDGNLDLIVSAGGQAPGPRRSLLYAGNGDGTFRRPSGGIVTNQTGFFNACAWADYDNDGFLDLFVTNNGDPNNGGGNCLLFHNNGDGTFAKIDSGAPVTDIGVGWGVQWSDHDNDGFMDLYVINLGNDVVNFLYHNDGNGRFTRVMTNAIVTDRWTQGAIACAWADYDNDGLQDVFVTDQAGVRNRLYRNTGRGGFVSVTSAPMLAPPFGGNSMGSAWGDFDNDGWLDLFVASRYATNTLFRNNGDGTFTQIFAGSPANDGGPSIASKACSWVDYDNDGFLDLFVTTDNGPEIGNNFLYRNNGNSNGWLEVKCVGTVANRSAIGTKVRVRTLIGGKTFWQLREINGGGGYSTAPLVAHFGLGDATTIETLRVEWPSGTSQEWHNVLPRHILTIIEPPRLTAALSNGERIVTIKGGRNMEYLIEGSADLRIWSRTALATITNVNGTAAISDAPAEGQKFYRALGQ